MIFILTYKCKCMCVCVCGSACAIIECQLRRLEVYVCAYVFSEVICGSLFFAAILQPFDSAKANPCSCMYVYVRSKCVVVCMHASVRLAVQTKKLLIVQTILRMGIER